MVSVIIVVYNGEKFIGQAIESVLNQTYKDIELVVVDDGSTDSTRDIIESYKDVKYIYEENSGQATARNLGIENSKGKYIAFLDADDLYMSKKIEKQVSVLEKNPQIDVIYNDLRVVDENLNYLSTLKSEGIYVRREDLLANIMDRQVIQGPVCMMLRRKCTERVKWNKELSYVNDYDYIINLLKQYNFKYLEEELYIYRRHGNNFSNKHNESVHEEKNVIRNIGIKNIQKIVNESSFNNKDKKFLLARIYIKINQYKKAREILKENILKNDNELLYFYLGLCNYKLHNINVAYENFRKAIEINCELAEAYNNLGCCLILKNQNGKAKNCFKKALELRNEYIDAKNNLKCVTNKSKEIKVTEKQLRKILTIYS
ncbi:glycosyltransferase [Clostridium butyricum]|uniref:glycosyltransferase n=1 Tax=Clostridium butyricum TaxID=1492 RepID=UPI00374EEDB9